MPTGHPEHKGPAGRYPQKVPSSSAPQAPAFVRLPGMYAVHGRGPAPAGELVCELEGDAIRVYRGQPDDLTSGRGKPAAVSPVYGLGGQGPPAVPTGQVLVRFADGVRIEDRRDQIERAGYALQEPLAYAPQAGWVQAASGGIAAALEGIPRLAALPDVAQVEPQMLMPRSSR
jgi:hypothetical protein